MAATDREQYAQDAHDLSGASPHRLIVETRNVTSGDAVSIAAAEGAVAEPVGVVAVVGG